MSKKIELIIDPAGNVTVEAFGYKGQGCKNATKALEEALAGGGEAETTWKPEADEMEDERLLQEQGLG